MDELNEALDKVKLSFLLGTHMNAIDDDCAHWYVGVTNDIERRLGEHDVRITENVFRREATSNSVAKAVEREFHGRGAKGGGQGGSTGDPDSRWLYAYLMTNKTKQ